MSGGREERIFLAGAAGAVGRRLGPMLVAAGWRVTGTTRSAEKARLLESMGVEPVVVDVFDADALRYHLTQIEPDVVIHQLTDLPAGLAADRMAGALTRTARLRDEGTRNLVAAATAARVRRMIAQSIALVYADGPLPHGEDDPLLPETHPEWGETVRGVKSLERQVLQAPLEGIVLRYGLLYGPGTGFDQPVAPGAVHVDAAARAAALAARRGEAGVYNIAARDGHVSVEKAVRLLGWDADCRPA